MQPGERKAHWEAVYEQKAETQVSWFQESPELSLELIAALAPLESLSCLPARIARHGM